MMHGQKNIKKSSLCLCRSLLELLSKSNMSNCKFSVSSSERQGLCFKCWLWVFI